MSTSYTQNHTFTDQLYDGIQQDYTKRLVNKMMMKMLQVYEEDFFMLRLYVVKTGKKVFRCQLAVEAYKGDPLYPVEMDDDSARYMSTLCTILHAYNGYYADIFQWNTMTLSLHFEGGYEIHRELDTTLEKKQDNSNGNMLSNIIPLASIRNTTASKTNGSPL